MRFSKCAGCFGPSLDSQAVYLLIGCCNFSKPSLIAVQFVLNHSRLLRPRELESWMVLGGERLVVSEPLCYVRSATSCIARSHRLGFSHRP